jgi:tRNA (cytidine/uridine-2'-O-)-methyltransferase
MKKDHIHICLYKPEIPQNTGNIGRLVAATQCRLHLIRPFGFSTDDKNLRRAGLDYWPFLDLEIHDTFEDFMSLFKKDEVAFFSKLATKSYVEMPKKIRALVFGQETKGFPEDFHKKYGEYLYKIPMFHDGVRSLNLANSVSIVTYHKLLVA